MPSVPFSNSCLAIACLPAAGGVGPLRKPRGHGSYPVRGLSCGPCAHNRCGAALLLRWHRPRWLAAWSGGSPLVCWRGSHGRAATSARPARALWNCHAVPYRRPRCHPRPTGKETARRLHDLPAACGTVGVRLRLPEGLTSITTVRQLAQLLQATHTQSAVSLQPRRCAGMSCAVLCWAADEGCTLKAAG